MHDALSLPDLLRQTAARYPSLIAIHTDDGGRTFAAVDRASDAVAGALAARGIGRGDRVGLYCPNAWVFPVIYCGILKAGAVVTPINLLISPAEAAFCLADAGVRALFYHSALEQQVARVRPQLPGLEWCCRIDGGQGSDPGLDDLLAEARPAPILALDPTQDLAAILYTSGTTGRPKGAMLTHRNLSADASSVAEALEMRPGGDRLLVVLPLFHSFAATVGMLTPLLHGQGMIPLPRFDPHLVSAAVLDHQATLFLGVPSLYAVLLHLADEQVARWRGVRCALSGGAAMPVEVMRRFEARFGIPILEGDGPTECGPVTCVNPLHGVRKPGSVGLPVRDVEIEVMDEAGRTLPRGEIGELCVRGPNVMKGYWNLPEAEAESFFGAWFRTGDLGYQDEDGYLFMVDRKKDMIIVNGMNVYPRQVEEVLHGHPAIAEAAVVGEPHELHGEVVVAYLVLREGAVETAATLRAWARERLGQHQAPRRVILREALPRNAAGKVLKRELRLAGELERGIDARTG
jgi:long-chain acyl-CoA synthetase